MVHEHSQAGAAAGGGPLEHLQIAIGIPESGNGAAAYFVFDANRFFPPRWQS